MFKNLKPKFLFPKYQISYLFFGERECPNTKKESVRCSDESS